MHTLNCRAETKSDSVGIFNKLSAFGDNILENVTWQGKRGVLVIYPSGGYSAREGLAFGVMPAYSWHGASNPFGSGKPNTLTASMQFSTLGMVEMRSEVEWFLSEKWWLNARIENLRIRDRYWENYSDEQTLNGAYFKFYKTGGYIEISKSIGRGFYLGLTGRAYSYSIRESESGVIDWVSDYGNRFLTGIGPLILHDTRDHVLWPRMGGYIRSGILFYNTGGTEKQDGFYTFSIDARRFYPIRKSVLALQSLWDFGSGNTPFYLLPQLGGKERLRGIGHSRQVIDHNVFMVRGEWRVPVWWRIGAVVFAEMGQASINERIDASLWIYSCGGGLRFRILPNEPLHIRMDAGIASGGQHGVFISLRESF